MTQRQVRLKKVAEVGIEKDLSFLADWLASRQVIHKIAEESGKQSVYADEQYALEVQSLVARVMNDSALEDKMRQDVSGSRSAAAKWHMVGRPIQASVVFSLIIASLMVALMTGLGNGGPVLRALVFADPFQVADDLLSDRLHSVLYNIQHLQWWRFFTPALLHFSVLHVAFNMLWLWYLGGMVEIKQGKLRLLVLVLCSALLSNTLQYLETGPLFGGMSGVVYGLVGYCWLWDKVNGPLFRLPDALMAFMVVWLVIGYTGITSLLPGVGNMANTAHSVGLVTGLLIALAGKFSKHV